MKKLLIIPLAFILASCDASSSRIEIDPSKINYMKDVRTDLCYAVVGRSRPGEMIATSFSITNVPCSEAVLRLIPVNQRR